MVILVVGEDFHQKEVRKSVVSDGYPGK